MEGRQWNGFVLRRGIGSFQLNSESTLCFFSLDLSFDAFWMVDSERKWKLSSWNIKSSSVSLKIQPCSKILFINRIGSFGRWWKGSLGARVYTWNSFLCFHFLMVFRVCWGGTLFSAVFDSDAVDRIAMWRCVQLFLQQNKMTWAKDW